MRTLAYWGILTFLFTPVWAQSDLSTVRGVATDQTGAVAPNIKITLLDVERNTTRTTVTTSEGDYEIPFLVPGLYKLTATGPGFTDFVADQIRLTSREIRRIDVSLDGRSGGRNRQRNGGRGDHRHGRRAGC